jgi:hypothetical protein
MTDVLEDLDRLEAKATDDYKVGADLAVLSLDHLRPLLAALGEQANRHDGACRDCDLPDCPCGGRLCNCGARAAKEALAAVGRDIAKALEE